MHEFAQDEKLMMGKRSGNYIYFQKERYPKEEI